MDLSILQSVLGLGAAGSIVLFVLAVLLDNVAGILLAKKHGTFDPGKLGSFLESQFGTIRFMVVLGAVAVAVLAALASAPLTGSLSVLALTLGKLALGVAITGSAANVADVVNDLKMKVTELLS